AAAAACDAAWRLGANTGRRRRRRADVAGFQHLSRDVFRTAARFGTSPLRRPDGDADPDSGRPAPALFQWLHHALHRLGTILGWPAFGLSVAATAVAPFSRPMQRLPHFSGAV